MARGLIVHDPKKVGTGFWKRQGAWNRRYAASTTVPHRLGITVYFSIAYIKAPVLLRGQSDDPILVLRRPFRLRTGVGQAIVRTARMSLNSRRICHAYV